MSSPTDLFNKPFNVELIRVDEKDARSMGEVKELTIFDPSGNFTSTGLFSTEIFGQIGTEIRNTRFGYINLHCEVFHPLIYYAIIKLKSLHDEILAGKTLAYWDDEKKQFVKSNKEGSDTGFEFFMSHYHELTFEKSDSDKRLFLIKLIEQAKEKGTDLMKYHLVLPAGLRDYFVDDSGKPQEDEINTYYRKVLYQCSLIEPNLYAKDKRAFDSVRYSVQSNVYKVFEYLKSLLEGKNKLILGKWVTRKVFNSTRNVLSSAIEDIETADDPNRLKYNDSFVGIRQFLRCTIPKCFYEMKLKFLSNIFIENTNFSYLIDAKTLKRKQIPNNHIEKDYAKWTTSDGLEKIIADFSNLDIRHNPITLSNNNYYLLLVYKKDDTFKVVYDIDSVPPDIDKSFIRPMTYAEFLYLSVAHLDGLIPAFITRYPITGYGSIYPSYMKIRTTIKTEKLYELEDDFTTKGKLYGQFPIKGVDFYNTTSLHNTHLARLGADFDGDTISVIAVLTDEAIEEVNRLLNSKEYYISDDGVFNFSSSTDTLEAVMSYLLS